MRKPAFCICENKDAVTAKLISVFVFATRIVHPSSSYIQNFKPLAILCGCTAQFVSDLVGNPEDQFSHNEAQIKAKKAILVLTLGYAYEIFFKL